MAKNGELRSVYVADADRTPTPVGTVSMTRQEFADECDINRIMERYQRSGLDNFGLVRQSEPRYLNLSGMPDFQTAMQMMIDAQEAFMTLPAEVRREFDNDPGKFVAYAEKSLEDAEVLGQLRDWGLAAPEKVPEAPMRVEVVNPLPPAGPIVAPPKAP